MPSSIKNYAIDYNKDGKIDLYESLELSSKLFEKNMGKRGVKVQLSKKMDSKNFTYDARKLAKQKSQR